VAISRDDSNIMRTYVTLRYQGVEGFVSVYSGELIVYVPRTTLTTCLEEKRS